VSNKTWLRLAFVAAVLGLFIAIRFFPNIRNAWAWWQVKRIVEKSEALEKSGASFDRYREILGNPVEEGVEADGTTCAFYGNGPSGGIIVCAEQRSGRVIEVIRVRR
jgi:hypothetical protein